MKFRPSITATVVLALLAVAFARLGAWQLSRADEKQALIARFEAAPSMTLDQALAAGERFARLRMTGRFDPSRHVLLDNQVRRGQVGVHVLTPFTTTAGRTVLVNRGWLATPVDRSRLPGVPTPAERVTIEGVLATPPVVGRRLGEALPLSPDRWPQRVTYLEIPDVARATGLDLPEWVVWLAAEAPGGFEGRDWSPVVMTPERHRGYALQWFALCAAAFILWIVTGVARAREDSK